MAASPIPFHIAPQRVHLQSARRELSTSRAEGMIQTRVAAQTVSPTSGKRELRRWVVEWDLLPNADAAALEASWASTAGGAQPTLWTPPGESPLQVNVLEWERGARGPRWNARALFEEAL